MKGSNFPLVVFFKSFQNLFLFFVLKQVFPVLTSLILAKDTMLLQIVFQIGINAPNLYLTTFT